MRAKQPTARPRDLAEFVDQLQSSGRYSFTREEAILALGVSDVAMQASARRLAAKGRIVAPRRGFYVIAPVEYRSTGPHLHHGSSTICGITELLGHLAQHHGDGMGLPNCSRMKVTNPPEVAKDPMYPFRYSRSRHSTSKVTWPLRSSGMLAMTEILAII